MQGVKLIKLHGFSQIIFCFVNLVLAVLAASHGALLGFTRMLFVNPGSRTADAAKEFSALFTIVTDILKIKFGSTAIAACALNCGESFLNKFTSVFVSC
jgi:hypothetical protein